jgi:hypothetical protein
MAVQTISIADALNRVKVLNARIQAAQAAPFVALSSADRIPGFASPAAAELAIRAAYQSVTGLISNYAKLKAAIVQSNAVTQVTLAGQTMTVAAAIERKKSIVFEQTLLQNLTAQFQQTQRTVDSMNTQAAAAAEKQAIAFFGDKADKTGAEYAQFVASYLRTHQSNMIDPIGIEHVIVQLNSNIQDFLAQVDLTLTTSNVGTMIEIDLAA